MSQWFDMWSTENPLEREADQHTDLAVVVQSIHHVIDRESRIVGAQNVILGGISQGCAVAAHALLKQNKQLGGFVGLCGWLPLQDTLPDLAPTAKALWTPVFLAHAQDDEVIAIQYGEQLRDGLIRQGINVRYQAYVEGGHWVKEPRGVDDLVYFLGSVTK